MVLNMYELLPFWHTLFSSLGYSVVVSPFSTRAMYQSGQGTIPSDTACYPAKLTHGHMEWLIQQNVDYIFYPCLSYNVDEHKGENHYNCPIVAYYPETLKDNMLVLKHTTFLDPFIDISNRKTFEKKFISYVKETFHINDKN